jgi:mono/diheme cytochrome c family protein
MKRFTLFLLLLTTTGSLVSLPEQTSSSGAKESRAGKTESKKAGEISRGETVFQQNCSRCHNAPQGFPPQISATIARHMRVRASLSAADEKALLKFLNP